MTDSVRVVHSPEAQLALWLQGQGVHRKFPAAMAAKMDDPYECCPDFSCCYPELLAPQDVREAFCKATTEKAEGTRNAMLGIFLAAMLAKAVPDAHVHVAGDGSEGGISR